MKSFKILIVLCFGVTLTSSLYNIDERIADENWWMDSYIKFNSPSGKTYYIDPHDGTIFQELKLRFRHQPQSAKKELPFISFVSVDLKIYDIYFDSDGINNQKPRLEESSIVYKVYKMSLILHSLRLFVGPNKKVYQVSYHDANKIGIVEKSSEVLDHFQIKTYGPYEKWEHTYDFSENGEYVVNHTISPIPVQTNRSILLPEANHKRTFVKFYAASSAKYLITDELEIVTFREDAQETAYITFTEPNGRSYDVNIDEKDGSASLVEKSAEKIDFDHLGLYLYSFVTPNGVLYRIDHKNGSDLELSTLVQDANADDSSDLQITLVQRGKYQNKFVKYIFSENGKKLFDRVDEIDWTPLNEQPALPVKEVTADYLMTNEPFLTLYTPSGNNYHIFTIDTNATIDSNATIDTNTTIAVEKAAVHSQSVYISYSQVSGRKTYIHFVAGAAPYLMEGNLTGNEHTSSFWLSKFSAPDQNKYFIRESFNETQPPSIEAGEAVVESRANRVFEPFLLGPGDGLYIKIQDVDSFEYTYRFTWNGDKLVEASVLPPIKVFLGAISSLVGGGGGGGGKILLTLVGR